ncbi:MAG: hypothetical protein ACOYMG_26215, partial [Candidatus Methylumidiphilus sp.]
MTDIETIALYGPGNLKPADLVAGFVAREKTLAYFLNELRHQTTQGASPRHHLIIGQRGMGKTTLLLRIAVAIGEAADLTRPNAVELAAEVGRNKPAPAGVSGNPADRMPETVVARPYSGLQPNLNSTALPPTPRFSLLRLFSYTRREALELRRDPLRGLIALFGTLLLMFTFGYGISM